ncbi:hypothetical protein ACHAWF_004929 [Thalassiosira exigua]
MDDAKPGRAVEFRGLKGAAHLNGTRGRLVRFLREEGRWAVRCDDGGEEAVVKAKPENLVLASSIPSWSNPPRSIRGEDLSLHSTVMESFYKRRKGGAVVSFGRKYMLAVEFNGPARGGTAIEADMVFVDNDPSAQAVVRGRRCSSAKALGAAFLRGEEVEYLQAASEGAFFDLLARYWSGSKSEGLIDMGSGLKMHSVMLIG